MQSLSPLLPQALQLWATGRVAQWLRGAWCFPARGDVLEGFFKGDTDQARVTADLEKTPGIGHNLSSHLEDLKTQMLRAAENLQFEEAAKLRDQIQKLEKTELEIKKDPFTR